MDYFLLLLFHLFAAILFVGTVFFEVLMLEGIRRHVPRDAMRAVESAIGQRARRIMPFAIVILYAAGVGMAWRYRTVLAQPFDSTLGTLLSLKILLALSVLGHFIYAVRMGALGRLKSRQSRLIHLSVFVHVVVIVFLAKAMFYLN
ncbi:CopD family copper resistance protein [Pusillimonas sp.]|uniref:CopD family copper resistance protein n=1 Tax=Pusillimonas sp. TaxID=3040095 RepID=UPI0037C733DD